MANPKKIGDILVEQKLISKEQLKEALREQSATGKRIGEILVERGFITDDQLTSTISVRLSVPKVSLPSMVIDPQVIKKVPVDIARRYSLIPIFAIGNTLTIAMSDPLNIIAIDELKYSSGLNIKRALATQRDIRDAIDQYYSVADSLNQIIGDRIDDTDKTTNINISDQPDETEHPIVSLVNLIISKAVKDRASDIHIEADENQVRIRYRINNVMREEAAPPKSMQNELISRIKIAADLDVAEKRLPQDGRFTVNVDGVTVDLRISTLPTIHGEKIAIRILDRRNLLHSFKELGFNDTTDEKWNSLIHRTEGLLLISGPTSSGKTSTLYATLQEINSIEKNIITVEDPVEYSLPIINQIQINEKAGLTFPSTLRAILRQNPDILMIGEIRDTETARMAIRSSLTGHLVFSTLHTNDAPSAVTRLTDMGIENYLLASALQGVLAQRLVRTNCPDCLETYHPSELILQRAGIIDLASDFDFKRGTGCNKCRNSGYKGLTGIFELVLVNSEISEMIIKNLPISEIKEAARKFGYCPLFEAGLEKVRAGIFTIENLLKEVSSSDIPSLSASAKTGFENANRI